MCVDIEYPPFWKDSSLLKISSFRVCQVEELVFINDTSLTGNLDKQFNVAKNLYW